MVRAWTESGTGAIGTGTVLQAIEAGYDSMGRVASLTQVLGRLRVKTSFICGSGALRQGPGLPYGLKVDGTKGQGIAYDSLDRKTRKK